MVDDIDAWLKQELLKDDDHQRAKATQKAEFWKRVSECEHQWKEINRRRSVMDRDMIRFDCECTKCGCFVTIPLVCGFEKVYDLVAEKSD